MQCKKCNHKAEVHISHLGDLCGNCFLRTIEKRVRKEVRIRLPFSKGDKILVVDDGSTTSFVTLDIVKRILHTMPVQLEVKKKAVDEDFKTYDKVLVPWHGDDALQGFLSELFEKKEDISPKGIRLLECLLGSEVDAYAQLKGFNGKRIKIATRWEDLEERYPGGKFALLRSKEILKD